MDTFFKLKGTDPLSFGGVRWVFKHPEDPDLLIKIIRHDAIEARFGKKTKWYKRPRRYGIYLSYIREIQEFITIHAKFNTHYPYLQRIVGFAQTDLGLGLVVQAIHGKDGQLAPTLRQIIDIGNYDETIQKALSEHLELLLNTDVVINDLNAKNMVYAYSPEKGHYFVLIDGLGNNTILPFKQWSKTISRRSKLKRFKELYRRIEIFKDMSKQY